MDNISDTSILRAQKIMTTSPVSVSPNFSQPFEILCDVSGRGVRALLMEEKNLIAFFNNTFSKSHSLFDDISWDSMETISNHCSSSLT